MAGGGVLGIATGGLMAYQRAIQNTSHNISNVNTEGYSRQTVEFGTRAPELAGNGFIGNGVEVGRIQRAYNQYIVSQVREGTSSHSELDAYSGLASRVDNLLADPQAGLAPSLDSFFNAVHGVASDPGSVAARQVMLTQGDALAERFHYIDGRLASLDKLTNSQIENTLTEINTLTSNVADMNRQIVRAMGQAGGQPPNDLLDQRDQMISKLAERIGITTTAQDDGSVNVFVGNGQTLVAGGTTQILVVMRNQYDPTRYEVGYRVGASPSMLSDKLTGGTLTGLLNFRKQVLDPAHNALGRVAVGVAQTFNRQHALGMDMDGAVGGDFFTEAPPLVQPSSNNSGAGTVDAALVNAQDLTSSDYVLRYGGGNSYTLTRVSDNKIFAIDTGGSSPYTTEEMDGISLTINAGATVGDKFTIKPAGNGASSMSMLVTDTRKIAAAAPIRSSAAYTNVGSGKIGVPEVNSPGNRVRIQFTSATTYDVVDETGGATLAQNLTYTSGANISFNGWTAQVSSGGGAPAAGDRFYVDNAVTTADSANSGGAQIGPAAVSGVDPGLTDGVTITFTSPTTFNVAGASTGSPTVALTYVEGTPISFNGWTVNVTGTPAAGDSFTVGPNTDGTGDNRNALRLASLQNKQTLAGGTATYQGAYGQMVADVGARTSEARVNRDARASLLNQMIEERDAASGVNLDEEAANLMKYQQGYQAVAQLVSVVDTLFQTILGAVRR